MIRAHIHGAARAVRNESLGFKAIFAAAFLALLCVGLLAQLLSLQWRSWLPGAESEKSLVGGVKAAVYTFMPNIS